MSTPPHEPMDVVVRDRRQGKTTTLIDWLLEGKQTQDYPGWSRVIVCVHTSMVVHTTRMLRMASDGWQLRNEQLLPNMRRNFQVGNDLAVNDLRKCVWSIDDFKHNAQGRRDFEYAVDNVELFLQRFLPPYKPPSVITVTGVYRP